MMFPTGSDTTARRHLLIPIMPTPNGRFHLGHIAGPYLKMDLIARHLRRRGDQAWIITGTDSYESYVLRRAEEQNRDPVEVCTDYHKLIECDLAALDIELDAFISPVSSSACATYRELHHEWVRRMERSNGVVAVTERLPFDAVTNRYAGGCWLSGRCPDCASPVTSYFCEDCGTHFRPEELLEPQGRKAEDPLLWRPVTSLFLRLPEPVTILAHLERMAVPARFRAIAERFLTRNRRLLRLSVPGDWGVPLTPDGGGPRSLFSYTGLLPYSLLCGDLHADLTHAGSSAFAAGSDVVTVSSFGIDNTIPMLVGAIGGALLDPTSKPFDHFLVNHFYQLEGEKFSTSRDHAIWVSDIVAQPRIVTDAIRYYLAKVSPDSQTRSLDVQDFVNTVNSDLAGGISRSTGIAVERLRDLAGEPGPPPYNLLQRLESAAREQAKAFEYTSFSSADAVAVLLAWSSEVAAVRSGTDAYWWLKGLALLVWPVMPRFGGAVWDLLGGHGEPAVSRFSVPSVPDWSRPAPGFGVISRADLDPCLPRALRTVPQ
ncbi:MAG TPA: methionine--tRNA ligase [Amycolatopsis sp.]|uniref:methionine--tRNA ligase n=1 Tax=Amycolatopsis sp. TaxID=37632 RepID=UPI002B4A2D62|nr:methionine--tRNA ligase [Amycolatopsis sp.]HKS50078.1 methionine--tRNA ligase [Amycolatopsis sp.]